MDLERDQLKISFSHPFALSFSSSTGFKTSYLTMDARKIPLPDKINIHRKTGELIYNDLSKTFSVVNKPKDMFEKVISQLKLEKENSMALITQNEEFKKLVVEIGVNP